MHPSTRRMAAAVAIAVVSIVASSTLIVATRSSAQAAGLTLRPSDPSRRLLGVRLGRRRPGQDDLPAARDPMPALPNAKTQPFYVVAPQTDTPQGDVPAFVHDHTIAVAPTQGSGSFTVFMHGYYAIYSQEGISTGACDYSLRTIPGGSIPLALSVDGEPLTSAATIGAGIDAGLLVAIDTGAAFVGNVSPHR
jgi:hypothetical protein